MNPLTDLEAIRLRWNASLHCNGRTPRLCPESSARVSTVATSAGTLLLWLTTAR